MPNELEGLSTDAAFGELLHLSSCFRRIPLSAPGTHLVLSCLGPSDELTFSAVAALIEYARAKYGMKLVIAGGGYACVEIGFSAEGTRKEDIESAIDNDQIFQQHLNATKANIAVIRDHGGAESCYIAYHVQDIYIATNRKLYERRFSEREGLTGIFGSDYSTTMTYAIVETMIYDPFPNQLQSWWLGRIWRRVLPRAFERTGISVKVNRISFTSFTDLPPITDDQWLVLIHGYANSFDSAIREYSIFCHRADVRRNRMRPLLYSWPSFGHAGAYFRDVTRAEESEKILLQLLTSIANKKEPLNVLAHSHGNKVLIRCLNLLGATELIEHSINKLILIAPDVDQEWFNHQLVGILRASKQATVYVSQNDEAIRLSAVLNGETRLHRLIQNTDPNLVFIDASRASKSWMGHDYYSKSNEVIGDIFYLLQDVPPMKRFGLMGGAGQNTWALI
ncbi:MAG: alpha/beta hydrolase [Rhizobiaceae bacterium]